jgi:hypothetical protein
VSHVPGRRAPDWTHVPRAPAQPAKIVPAIPKTPPKTQSRAVPALSEVRYLGHIVSLEGIPTDPQKLESVRE